MVFKEGQTITVKKVEDLKNNKKYRCSYNGDIFYSDGGNITFNTFMQKKEKVKVKRVISNHTFLGDDNWYWYDWMLELPKSSILMETE